MEASRDRTYEVPLHNRILRRIARPIFRALFHVLGNVVITGKQNIPGDEACIVAINHISIFEPPLVLSFWPKAPEAAGAIDLWSRRGISFLANIYGGIPVHRGQYDRQLMNTLLSVLRSGRSLVIAPEGGRSHTPGMQRALPGVAYLVDQVRVRIIPVGVFGSTEDFLDQAMQGKRPTIGMNIGKPFTLPALEGQGMERRKARQHNADLVMLEIAALLPFEYHGVYNKGIPEDVTNQAAAPDFQSGN
jgi:1-acyl-sn-glycerol-3-phosphate acyltransferase